jgi:hypothetical protein
MRSKAVSLLLAPVAAALPLFAFAANDADTPSDTVGIYAGHGIDHDLPQIPGAMMRGRWRWQDSYFAGAGLGHVRGTLGQSFDSLHGTMFANVRHGYEIVVLKHHGMQSNAEVGAAYTLRTPDLHAGPVGVNFSTGGGLSYAIGNPTYEDGPRTIRRGAIGFRRWCCSNSNGTCVEPGTLRSSRACTTGAACTA